jgi:hypothetical protein
MEIEITKKEKKSCTGRNEYTNINGGVKSELNKHVNK